MILKTEYRVNYRVQGSDYGELVVPKGTRVTHQTACGPDESYHFVDDFSWVTPHENGIPKHSLLLDLQHYGLNVPAQYIA